MKAKSVIVIAIFVSAIALIIFSVKREETPKTKAAVVGLNAPGFLLDDPSGKTYTLSELKGSVVFINFWATWCPPCIEEIPSIQNLYNGFKDKKEFRMVTILYKDDYDKAMAFLKQNNYTLPVLIDREGKAAKAYGLTGVPETYIVDKQGVLREKVIGPADWNSTQADSLISNLLKQ
ncbi:MAG TPA: TlpA disulfide reductase family protein [Thermodesulfovibrionales bacterium]|nr:TlpA disulfide reductase family protein [Thermodesulfovibrionales bacterium]